MDEIEQVQNLTQAVMCFVAFKMKALAEQPPVDKSAVSLELVDNLCKIVWVERYIFASDSEKFMRDHIERMNEEGHYYILYTLYLCYLTKECFSYAFEDSYEIFIRTMTLLFTLATYTSPDRLFEAVCLAATIFTFYFDVEINSGFHEQGGIQKFNEYLLQRATLAQYSNIEVLEVDGEMRKDIFYLLNKETSRLKVHLSKDIKANDIEGHEPSHTLLQDVLLSGSGSMLLIAGSGAVKIRPPIVNLGKGSKHEEVSKKPPKSELSKTKIEQTPQGQNSSKSAKIAYRKAIKHVQEFHAMCRKLELLLDSFFKEPSNDGEQREQ